jgi:hypothetical protein
MRRLMLVLSTAGTLYKLGTMFGGLLAAGVAAGLLSFLTSLPPVALWCAAVGAGGISALVGGTALFTAIRPVTFGVPVTSTKELKGPPTKVPRFHGPVGPGTVDPSQATWVPGTPTVERFLSLRLPVTGRRNINVAIRLTYVGCMAERPLTIYGRWTDSAQRQKVTVYEPDLDFMKLRAHETRDLDIAIKMEDDGAVYAVSNQSYGAWSSSMRRVDHHLGELGACEVHVSTVGVRPMVRAKYRLRDDLRFERTS